MFKMWLWLLPLSLLKEKQRKNRATSTIWKGATHRVLDLIVTNENNMIDDIQYLGPLGKKHHCVLFDIICYVEK